MLLAAGEGTCRAERSERACGVTGRKACGAGSIQDLRPANKHTAALFLLLQSAGSGKILEVIKVSALTVQYSKFDLSQLVCRKPLAVSLHHSFTEANVHQCKYYYDYYYCKSSIFDISIFDCVFSSSGF